MTNMVTNKNAILDEVVHYQEENQTVLDIRLEEQALGVTFLLDEHREVFKKVDAPNVLHLTWMRNEAAAYLATINKQGRKGA